MLDLAQNLLQNYHYLSLHPLKTWLHYSAVCKISTYEKEKARQH